MIPVELKGTEVEALLDTGASRSLVTEDFARRTGIQATSKQVQLRGVGQCSSKVSVPVKVKLFGKEMEVEFLIVEALPYEVIIGDYDARRTEFYSDMQKQIVDKAREPILIPVALAGEKSTRTKLEVDEIIRPLAQGAENEHISELVDVMFSKQEAWSEPIPGRFSKKEVQIHLKYEPRKGKLRSVSPKIKDIISEHVDKMLDQGVIRPSNSRVCSPVHMVAKSDGEMRFCVDYKEINDAVDADRYPIPLMWEFIGECVGYPYYIKLDLKAGYWNIRVAEASIPVTAFITHRGLYEFLVMPFGLKNAPAEFQRIMDEVFGHLYSNGVKIYFDDIVIFANSIREIFDRLSMVLDLAIENGLYFNIKKCSFLQPELELLGHHVGYHGYRPLESRLQALVDAKPPRSKKELHSFIGCMQFVKRFYPNFDKVMLPLRALMKKSAVFNWTTVHQEAFEEAKQMLMTRTMLTVPKGTGAYVLITDASDFGVGGGLMQFQEEGLEPIIWISKTLSETERNWDQREKEAYAIKFCLEKTKNVVQGHKIHSFTDNESLQWMRDAPQSKIQRWLWYLQQFDLEIIHIAGKQNHIGDWLSRSCYSDDHDMVINEVSVPVYVACPEIQVPLMPTLEDIANVKEVVTEQVKRVCQLDGNNLYRTIKDNRLYVPYVYRSIMLFWMHAGPYGVHRGISSTYKRLRRMLYWPTMKEDVTNYISKCLPCQANQVNTRNTVYGSLGRSKFNDLISLDYVGPRVIFGETHYFLTIVEHSSRFMMVVLNQNQSTDNVLEALTQRWIPVMGVPNSVLTDNGSVFTSQKYREAMFRLGIISLHSSPYYPQGNGINESSHQVLEKGITIAIQVAHGVKNVTELVSEVVTAYNASFHSAIRSSPYFAVYGREAVLPGFQRYNEGVSEEVRHYTIQQNYQLSLLREMYRITVIKSKLRENEVFQVGDLVMFKLNDDLRTSRTYFYVSGTNNSVTYAPKWSLVCRVESIFENQARVIEIPTGLRRSVPFKMMKRVAMTDDRYLKVLNNKWLEGTQNRSLG